MSYSSENMYLYSPFDDPMFLSPTDQPSLALSSFLFDGTSFLQWQREVVAALLSKNKRGFLYGECSLPAATDKKYNQWIRCDLLNLQFVMSCKALWTDIVERFGQPNILEVYELKKDLGRITQDNFLLLNIMMLKRLVDRETQVKLLRLFMGLTSRYEHAQTNQLSIEPLPPINKALGMLQKVERQKHINDQVVEVSVETTDFASKKRFFNRATTEAGNAGKRPKKDPASDHKFCSHCEKVGHTIEECYMLMSCTFCKIKGHIQERCYKYKAFLKGKRKVGSSSYAKANNVDVLADDQDYGYQDVSSLEFPHAVSQAISDAPSTSSSDLKSSVNFSGMHLSSHVFIASLTDFNDHDWIVDTGASDHITSNIQLMHNVKNLAKPVYVGLPDGTIKVVHKFGQVYLRNQLTLHDVLLIPDLQQNLLAVAKLITATGLIVCFLKTKCVFQDHKSKAVAEAKRIGNLYRFRARFSPVVQKVVPFCSNKTRSFHCHINATSVTDIALVHSRFGHSSLEKLQHVHGINLKEIKQFHCETCVFAKHHIFPFLRSMSYAKNCFD
ncbi:uncharacterized protein LOC141617309 [Silene latifolia]|uniref:uncharacterized protein LOC141617309 n=1 Tax=Silene latifolia TaxID=37657 RepID=UPI003D76D551